VEGVEVRGENAEISEKMQSSFQFSEAQSDLKRRQLSNAKMLNWNQNEKAGKSGLEALMRQAASKTLPPTRLSYAMESS
jgi:hypothetical protein